MSGLALLPYIGLPSERFSWQQFALVYGEQPVFRVYFPVVENVSNTP